MKTKKALLSLVVAAAICSSAYAREDIGNPHKKGGVRGAMATGCAVDAGAAYMQINNVRARIMDEGDMWWDPGAGLPRYYVPANGQACSLFAGALWIGGVDAGGQLKVAAMTYRQNGEDFWTGPAPGAATTPAQCLQYDKLFYVTRQEVDNWVANNGGTPPPDIANWPGNGPDGKMLAPYIDVDGSGDYNPGPGVGDYPAYDLTGSSTSQNILYGDATLWWVFNDVGNTHTESGGIQIGLEVRAQCFAFQTNDAINNMTFYNYEVINQSTYQVNNCYFGAWVDPDLGNGADDYVGCDVGRSMGYCYNGEAIDNNGSGFFAGEIGYGNTPPAVGVDFFQGPIADPGDKDCYVQTVNGQQRIGMAKFVYYNNDFTVIGNPTNASHYYNYLRGMWQDGTHMTYGGNGYQTSSTLANYMFCWTPAGCSTNAVNTDPTGCGTGGVPQATPWDEIDAGNPYGDRRFLESAGPFTLKPGAVNYVTTGVVWDQNSTPEGNIPPICLIQQDDDLAQALFNNHFRVLDGPDAPDLNIQELNDEVIISLSNKTTSNNYKEAYNQVSPTIVGYPNDNKFKFEGYEIFQVIDSTVTGTQILDPSKARLVAECDIKNGVTSLVNYTYNASLGATVPTLEVTGQDKGIVHSFDIKKDQFQEDNIGTLVNDRPYYYLAIAYAYNNYKPFDPSDPTTDKGQMTPYLQGRRNIKVYKAIPHIPQVLAYNGTISAYGSGPAITRLEGHGNGANVIQLDQKSIDYILQHDTMAHPTYLPGRGPVSIKVVDPLSVINANFILKIIPGKPGEGVDSNARWELDDITRNWKFYSDTTIGVQNEQIIPQYGISISINTIPYPSGTYDGVIDSACTMTFADPSKAWLTGVPSAAPGESPLFWIRSGSFLDKNAGTNCANMALNSYPLTSTGACPNETQANFADPHEYYNKILGGTWAPFALCAYNYAGDASLYCDYGIGYPTNDSIANIASIDIVFTSDQSKWTRCIVLEEQDIATLAQGGATKLDPRKSPSISIDGTTYATVGSGYSSNPNDPNYISDMSMGWFPGYAINEETGERLNMAFGEDSWLNNHNGRDMKWNPDSVIDVPNGSFSSGSSQLFGVSSVFGGKHYIYVFAHNNNYQSSKFNIPAYDKDSTILSYYLTGVPKNLYKGAILGDVVWAGIPLLAGGHKILETDATVRLRVEKPYDTAYGSTTVAGATKMKGSLWRNNNPQNDNYPMYSFSTSSLVAMGGTGTAANDSALNLINIVPNPYYAYSSYESNRLDNRVRIINLPPVCNISIFTVSGSLVKVINKNGPLTYIDWNLENQFSVPIASGIYIIHVSVPNVGEKTLKWFGVMRPTDLNSY